MNFSLLFDVSSEKNDSGWAFNHRVGRHGPINHMIRTGSYDFYDLTLWVGVYHDLSTRQSKSFPNLIRYYYKKGRNLLKYDCPIKKPDQQISGNILAESIDHKLTVNHYCGRLCWIDWGFSFPVHNKSINW